MKIGIYPGTFDPLHDGHITFAITAAEQLGLDRIIMLPERSPRGKTKVSSFEARMIDIERKTAGHPNLSVDSLADERFTTAHTLPDLLHRYPAHHLTLLIGSDVALGLADWPGIDTLIETVDFAIGMRERESASQIMALLEAIGAKYRLLTTSHPHLRSSQLR